MTRKFISVIVVALAASCLYATYAQGSVTCSVDGERRLLEVHLNERHDFSRIETHDHQGPPEIIVWDGGSILSCAGPGPTTRSIDSIKVEDLSDGNTALAIESPDHFAPGATSAGGDEGSGSMNEIEWRIRMGGGGRDQVTFWGYATPNVRWRFGALGFNPRVERTGTRDTDVFLTGVEKLLAIASSANDVLRADGGAGTGGPFRERISLFGENGDDLLIGGSWPDQLDGGSDDDELRGMGGGDLLIGSYEADLLTGGQGVDTASWPFEGPNSAVFADIGAGGANDGALNDESRTGNRRDRVMSDIENLIGGGERDVLIGDEDDNVIDARDGTVDKRIKCGAGRDKVLANLGDHAAVDCERVVER